MSKEERRLLLKFSKDALTSNNKRRMIVAALLSLAKAGISLMPPFMVMMILDVYIPEKDFNKVTFFSIIIIITTISISIIDILLEYTLDKIGKTIYILFQKKALMNLFHMNGNDYSKLSTGDIMTTLIQDIDSVRRIISSLFFEFLSDIVVAIALFFFLIRLDMTLTIIVVIALPVIFVVQRHFQKKCMKKADSLRKADGDITSLIEDCVSNIKNYVIGGFGTYFFKKHDSISDIVTSKEIELDVTVNINHGVISCIGTLLSVLVLSLGGMHVVTGAMTIGGLVAYNMYVQRLISPILQLTSLLTEMQILMVSIKKIYDILDMGVEKYGEKQCFKGKEIKGILDLDKVFFSYEDSTKVFEDASISFYPGKIYGIIGKSGSGKSTLVNLIFKLWSIDDASIVWGGEKINSYQIDCLRNSISVVGQDVHLLDDTIYNNISLGDQNITEEEVRRVAKAVDGNDFIMKLDKKYDTLIGEKGIKLSGGQKQRIAIARALIKKKPLLILDEATSALDERTEKIIMDNLVDETRDSIVIIISHRDSALSHADEIYAIENYRIKKVK